MPRPTLQLGVVDAIGARITQGRLRPGEVIRSEDLEGEYGVSRTVIRESLRSLETMGLVVARRSIGITVQPPSRWNVFDPRVIGWRLDGEGRGAQLESLTQLRLAVEPRAVGLAAANAIDEERGRLLDLADDLAVTGRAGDLDAFLEHDIAFHGLILAASRNEMLAALSTPIAAVLSGRTEHHLMPPVPKEESILLHAHIATCIARGKRAEGELAMVRLLQEVNTTISS